MSNIKKVFEWNQTHNIPAMELISDIQMIRPMQHFRKWTAFPAMTVYGAKQYSN